MREAPFLWPAGLAKPVITADVRPTAPAPLAYEVLWARHDEDVRAAQRLRYAVFADEMGARLPRLPNVPAGHDADVFDPYCEHLLVRTAAYHDTPA